MKKIIALGLALVLAMTCFTACGSSEEKKTEKTTTTKGSTIDISGVKLLNEGTLTVGLEAGYPPFESVGEDGSTPEGFDIDIATEVAKRLGVKVNFINTSFDGIFAAIDKNYDIVCSGVTITADRKKSMIFSTPYIENYQSVIVPADSKLEIKSFKDLNGKTVSVQKETTSDILMQDYKSTGSIDVEIVANEKLANCFTQLTNGEVDAIVVDSTVADGYARKEADKYKIAYTDESEPEEFAIAIGQKNTALQKVINEALAAMKADGFTDDTYDYWFGSGK